VRILLVLTVVMIALGCVTTYEKKVITNKDGDGEVVSVTIEERYEQDQVRLPRWDYDRNVQKGSHEPAAR